MGRRLARASENVFSCRVLLLFRIPSRNSVAELLFPLSALFPERACHVTKTSLPNHDRLRPAFLSPDANGQIGFSGLLGPGHCHPDQTIRVSATSP